MLTEGDLLLAVSGVFAAIQIGDHVRRCFRAGLREQLYQVLIQ